MKYPLTLTITVKIPNQTNAVDCVADLIDWERAGWWPERGRTNTNKGK